MPSTRLSFLTQKVIHPSTDHIFLLYATPSTTGETYQFDIQWLSEKESSENSQPQCRWWSGSWSETDEDGLDVESLKSYIISGELHIKGWNASVSRRSDKPVNLKLVFNPLGTNSFSVDLVESEGIDVVAKSRDLLWKITEEAGRNNCQLFSQLDLKGTRTTSQDDYDSELAQTKRQLKKKERELFETKAELEITSERLKEFILDQNKITKPQRSLPKIPLNHSKANATKKRRIVKKAEFEDE
ncbi:hypothetical protein FRC02_007523 [Tulasnella sp. 418]|nr:hypothetical protein FRC02_007523 [Tulasnella sp. 418]